MRTIPVSPSRELTQTERKVFDLVKQIDWGDGAVGISSLNLADHEYKRWGEIDFVLLGEMGTLAIEVKGGNVSCSGGLWRYATFKGRSLTRSESPYVQVKSAFFSLERHICANRTLGVEHHVPGGFCVVFASMRRDDLKGILGGPETPSILTGTSEDLESPATFRRFLDQVMRYWRDREPGRPASRWTPTLIKDVANFLRPDFDRTVPVSLRMRAIRDERVRFTEEQYDILDFLESQPRLLITGSAGCGKTFLAAEIARRESADGKRVLLVTGTDTLATYLRAEGGIPASVVLVSVKELKAALPGIERSIDVAIVDEGQQVTTAEMWGLLDRALSTGADDGRWRWFGDYARQVTLDSAIEERTLELLRMSSTHQQLVQNCRNTPQLVHAAEMISGVRIGRAMVKGSGPNLIWVTQKQRRQIPEIAAKQLTSWTSDDVSAEQIVLLYASEEGRSQAHEAGRLAGVTIREWGDAYRTQSRARAAWIASIREFRGLESEHVLVFGLDDIPDDHEIRALSYIAITRASFAAAIAGLTQTKERLIKLSLPRENAARGEQPLSL